MFIASLITTVDKKDSSLTVIQLYSYGKYNQYGGSSVRVQENWKATSYTVVVVGMSSGILHHLEMGFANVGIAGLEEGLEVNLGSDAGLGDDQPFLPGKPAQTESQAYTPPQKSEPQKADESKDFATDDKDKDAPEIKARRYQT